MITHAHRVYLLYFPERKKIFVNELGSLERKVFQHTVVNKKHFLKKLVNNFLRFLKIWSPYLGSLKNLVNIFRGLRKWSDMITPVIKVNESPPGPLCNIATGLVVSNKVVTWA